jgi:uncharacterized membrane protein
LRRIAIATLRRLAYCAALLLLSGVPALAADPLPAPGDTKTGWLGLGGRQVPLPPGAWRVAASAYGVVDGPAPGPYGAILSVALVQLAGERVAAVVIAQTNLLPVREGWGPASECERSDLAFSSGINIQARDLSCRYIAALDTRLPEQRPSPSWAAARRFIAAQGWHLPETLLLAGFRVGNRRDVLDVRYSFDPVAAPLVVDEAANAPRWAPQQIAADPRRQRTIAALAAWSEETSKALELRLAHPVDDPISLPSPWRALAPDAPSAGGDSLLSVWTLGVYKDLTMRVLMMSSSATYTYLLTGSFFSSGLMPAAQGVSHFLVYYANEIGWERPRPPSAQDFVAAAPRPAVVPRLVGAAIPEASLATAKRNVPAGEFRLGGKQVPLPSGRWEVAGQEREGEGEDAIESTVLVQLDGDRPAGIIVARSNLTPQKATFGSTAECDRSDIPLAVTRYGSPVDGFCIFVKHVVMAPGKEGPPAWLAARRWLSTRGAAVAGTWLMAGFRIRDRTQMLDLRYYFPPPEDREVLPVSWMESGWAVRQLESNAAHRQRIAELVRWTAPIGERVELGFRDQLGPAMQVPLPWSGSADGTSVSALRLASLNEMRATQAISARQYDEQLGEIRKLASEPEPVEMSFFRRTAYKASLYQAAALADTALVSWLILGSPYFSLAYTAAIQVTAPVAFYFNELYWARSGIGKPPMQKPREFAEIGLDR